MPMLNEKVFHVDKNKMMRHKKKNCSKKFLIFSERHAMIFNTKLQLYSISVNALFIDFT